MSTLISLRADLNMDTISGQRTTAAWLSARPDHVRILSEPWRQVLVGRCIVDLLVCRMVVGRQVGLLVVQVGWLVQPIDGSTLVERALELFAIFVLHRDCIVLPHQEYPTN